MSRYFMGDTRLGWVEKMMMDPSRTAPPAQFPLKETPEETAVQPNSQAAAEGERMSYVIKACLSNPGHLEYGQITVSFPIPNDQYDQLIEMLDPLKIGDPLK